MKTITWKLIGACLTAFIVAFGLKIDKAEAATSITILTPNESVKHVNNSIPLTDTSIYVNDTVTTTLPTSLNSSGTDSNGNECVSHATDYVWTITSVKYSKDGKTFATDSFLPSINGDSTGATGIMSCKFPNDINHPAGFWQINVHVHVDYTSNCGNGQAAADYGPLGYSVGMGDYSVNIGFTSPNTSTIPEGGTGVANLTVTPLAGFSGNVTMSTTGVLGITGDDYYVSPVYPNSVTRPYGIYVADSVPPGPYSVLVDGISGILNHGTLVTITVPKRYFEITSGEDAPGQNHSNSALNTRSPIDGSMSIDSAAQWVPDSPDPNDPGYDTGAWHGSSNLSPQNVQGFTANTSYLWVPTFGGKDGGSGYPNFKPSIFNQATLSLDDNLSSTLGGSQLNKVTSISLQIENTNSTFHTDNSYTIHWHYPFENWTKVGSGIPDNPAYTLYPASKTLTISANTNPQISVNLPAPLISGTGAFAFSAITGTTAAGLWIFIPGSGAALPATLLIASGYLITAISLGNPNPTICTSNFSDFDQDLKFQDALDAGKSSVTGINGTSVDIPDPLSQRIPSSVAQDASANNFQLENQIYNGKDGAVTVNIEAGIHNWVQNWLGDSYGATGYLGQKTEATKYQSTVFYVYNWIFGSVSPGPRG